jgi:DNA-binding response OmpR family regulator
VLRRSPERPRELSTITLPEGQIDLARAEVTFDDGTRVELSEKERELIEYLAKNSGRAISRGPIESFQILGRLLLRDMSRRQVWRRHA